jgi:hypothetical protein
MNWTKPEVQKEFAYHGIPPLSIGRHSPIPKIARPRPPPMVLHSNSHQSQEAFVAFQNRYNTTSCEICHPLNAPFSFDPQRDSARARHISHSDICAIRRFWIYGYATGIISAEPAFGRANGEFAAGSCGWKVDAGEERRDRGLACWFVCSSHAYLFMVIMLCPTVSRALLVWNGKTSD